MQRVRSLRALAVTATSVVIALGALPASVASVHHAAKAGDGARASSAAAWQASQLTKGRIHNGQLDFDDWGLTIDTAFALAASGDQPTKLAAAAKAIENNYYDSYATSGGDEFAGAAAKSLVVAAVLGADPATFGGHNVRELVLSLVAPNDAGFEGGRLRDMSSFGDFSNVFSQAYGVIGLARTGDVPQEVVDYLLEQQCTNGYFRNNEVAGKSCDDTAPKNRRPDVDATALAIEALQTAKDDGATVPAGVIHDAAAWLVSVQADNGSFGGRQAVGANTNSTGLASVALALMGRDKAQQAAADWVATLQITRKNADKPAAKKEIGAIAYNKEALGNALKNGIQTIERDQFRRATAQAIFAFKPVSLGTLTAQ